MNLSRGEYRASPQSSHLMNLIHINAVASRRLINKSFKYSIPALNSNCTITSIIMRLRTRQVKEMKFSTDGQRNYTNHCPNIQLSPQHVLSCPETQAKHFTRSAQNNQKI
ncbi:hypothetical protein TNCV_2463591 [Trichonephila clavipes]|nr:hypothetical protein TNCV_2463591 [Trichonephila clavipes]